MDNCVDDCLPYLRISRELLSVILARPTPRNRKDRVYALMQLRANYRDGVMLCQGVVFDCLRGQLISTREEIARQLEQLLSGSVGELGAMCRREDALETPLAEPAAPQQ